MVPAAIRMIFAQPDQQAVTDQFAPIVAMLTDQFPDVAGMLADARDDLLAFVVFPLEHWRKLWYHRPARAASPRGQASLRRRGGVFLNDAAIDRLVTAVIVEQHDEWAVAERRYLSETSMARLGHTDPDQLPAPTRSPRRLAG